MPVLKYSPSTGATLYNRARSKGYEVVNLPGNVLGIDDQEVEDE